MPKKISFNTNLIYFIVMLLFVAVRICSSVGALDFLGNYTFIMGFVTQFVLIFLIPLVLFKTLNKTTYKKTFEMCSYKKVSWRVVVASVVLGAVVFFLNIYVSNFFNSLIRFFGYKPSTNHASTMPANWVAFLLNFLLTAILPAICEETLHRGMLLKGNAHLGAKKAILISGLLFGLLHLNIEQFFYATIIGVFLGYLCMCTGSVYPGMIIHFMNNGMSVFLTFATSKGWAIGNVFEKLSAFLTSQPVIGFIMFMLVLCLLFVLAFELTMFIVKDTFQYNFGKRQKELANLAIRDAFFKQIDDIQNNTVTQNPLYKADKKVVYIDFKEFVNFIGKNMEQGADVKEEDAKIKEIEIKTKILMYGSIILGAIVTFMTFIWGILR